MKGQIQKRRGRRREERNQRNLIIYTRTSFLALKYWFWFPNPIIKVEKCPLPWE